MRRSRKYISMPIVSLEEGLQIGAVRNIVVDPVKMEIAALVIDQRGWFREQKIIPYAKVKSIGSDAITIDQSANVQKTISLPEMLKLIKEKANPLGARVITEDGTVLGIVDEYYVDEDSGKITTLEISGKMLESLFKGKALLRIGSVRTIGSDIIVATTDAPAHLEKVDGGLQETLQTFKEGTSNLWESTKQKTMQLSKNLKDEYDKRVKSKENGEAGNESLEAPAISEPSEPAEISVGSIEITDEDLLAEVNVSKDTEKAGPPDHPKGEVQENQATVEPTEKEI